MEFRRRNQLRGVGRDTRSLPREFIVRVPRGHDVLVRVHLRADAAEDNQWFSIDVHAFVIFDPSPHVQAAFEALRRHELPEGSKLTDRWQERPYFLTETGRLTGPGAPFDVLPQPMQGSIRQVKGELDAAITRTVALLRWRIADPGPFQPLEETRYEWSIDGGEWFPLPSDITGRGSARTLPPLTDQISREIQEYLDEETEAPLAHALWNEAWDLRGTARRAALLVGMAALEVGVKALRRSGGTRDRVALGEPARSSDRPNAERIPADSALERCRAQPLDKDTRELLRKAQHLRNKVAHAGRSSVDSDFVEQILNAVRAVLYRLDEARGLRLGAQPRRATMRRVCGVGARCCSVAVAQAAGRR